MASPVLPTDTMINVNATVCWLRCSQPRVGRLEPHPGKCRVFLLFTLLALGPWELTLKNEQVFHHILRRGCKAVGPGGPG